MRVRLTVLFVFLTLLCSISSAQICPKGTDFETCVKNLYTAECQSSCDAKDWRSQWRALQTYCANDMSSRCNEWRALKVGVLSLDHQSGDWSANAAIKERTRFDVNGKPEIALEHGGHFLVVVENTDPLLSGVELGEATRGAGGHIADLKELLKLFSGLVRQGVAGAVAHAGDVVGELSDPVRNLNTALERVECVTARTERQTRQIVTFLQAMETGISATYDPTPARCSMRDACAAGVSCGAGMVCDNGKCVDVYGFEYTNRVLSELEAAVETHPLAKCAAVKNFGDALKKAGTEGFAEARKAYEAAVVSFDCQALLSSTGGGRSQREQIAQVFAEIPDVPAAEANLAAAKKAEKAAEVARDKAKAKDQAAAQQRLDAAKQASVVAAETVAERQARLDSMQIAGDLLAGRGDMLTKANEILAKSGTLVNGVHQVLVFNERINDHALAVAAGGDIRSSDVATFLVVPKVPDSVAWDEEESHPFKVVQTSPFADQIKTPRPETVDTSYKVTALSARAWDVGVSVVRTEVSDPTFAAVGEDGAKTIALTDEKTRAGELAMFLHLGAGLVWPDVPKYFRTAGVELGAALSTDSPAFFAGVSVPLGRYLRLGYGYTAQRVTQLSDGKKVGSSIGDNDPVPTREGFENGQYVSLSISIGAINLFTKD